MDNSNILFLLSCLCAVWHKNIFHWHVTFAKYSEHLLYIAIAGFQLVGNLNKIQVIYQLVKNTKNHEVK